MFAAVGCLLFYDWGMGRERCIMQSGEWRYVGVQGPASSVLFCGDVEAGYLDTIFKDVAFNLDPSNYFAKAFALSW